jgi:hypothetical protein
VSDTVRQCRRDYTRREMEGSLRPSVRGCNLGLEPHASLLVIPCLEKSKEDMGLSCAEATRSSNGGNDD